MNNWALECKSPIPSLIVLGFNDTLTLVVLYRLTENVKKEIEEVVDEREGQGRKKNRNEREGTEEIKSSPSTLTCYKDSKPCPTVSQYQMDVPVT